MLSVTKGTKVIFDDCVVEFECPYCGHIWKADSRNGVEYCSCGAQYELKVALEIVPAKEELAEDGMGVPFDTKDTKWTATWRRKT